MAEQQTDTQKQLSIGDLEQKLVEVRLLKGEEMLKVLNERKKQVAESSPEKLVELEKQLSELESSAKEGLPEVVQQVIQEKTINLKSTISFIKNTSPEILDRNIEELQKRINFLKVFGI
jgi:predicted nucleic acid-binding OB-fold protein